MRICTILSAVLVLSAGACDNSAEKAKQEAAVKAAQAKKAEEEAALAKRKADREAKEAAEKAAEEAKAKQIDELCVTPEKIPANAAAACKAAGAAYDAYMARILEGASLDRWNQAKQTQLAMFSKQCLGAEKPEAGACIAEAFGKAPKELKKEVPTIIRRCLEKYGAGAAQAAAPPKGDKAG